jgi:hypothetical protein
MYEDANGIKCYNPHYLESRDPHLVVTLPWLSVSLFWKVSVTDRTLNP